jgi:hypothetical protein
MVLQGAALPILCVFPHVITRGLLNAQPASHASYSNVHPCHLGWCNDVLRAFLIHSFIFILRIIYKVIRPV